MARRDDSSTAGRMKNHKGAGKLWLLGFPGFIIQIQFCHRESGIIFLILPTHCFFPASIHFIFYFFTFIRKSSLIIWTKR